MKRQDHSAKIDVRQSFGHTSRAKSVKQQRRARIAQLVEQWPLKPTVGGSNPPARTKKLTIDMVSFCF